MKKHITYHLAESSENFQKCKATLIEKALENARSLGYKKIRLDVIPTLLKAKELYHSFGFYEIPPDFNNPVEGTAYMEKIL